MNPETRATDPGSATVGDYPVQALASGGERETGNPAQSLAFQD